MSYILEALKKSQQERQSGQIPDLQTIHPVPVAPDTSSLPRWPYWLIGILLLSLAFILGLTQPWKVLETTKEVNVPAPAQSGQVSRQTVSTSPVNSPVAPPVLNTQAVDVSTVSVQPEIPVRQVVIQPADSKIIDIETVPDLVAMPGLFQQAVPDMQFAGHVYSENPKQRSVIINGRSMSEGDDLMPGLRLVHITSDSVIFDYQGQVFKMQVLRDWSFD